MGLKMTTFIVNRHKFLPFVKWLILTDWEFAQQWFGQNLCQFHSFEVHFDLNPNFMYVECAILLSEKVAMLKIASHRIYLSPNFKGSYHSPSFMRRFFTILEIVWYYM